LTRLDPYIFYFIPILNKKKEKSAKKARLKGSCPFLSRGGQLPKKGFFPFFSFFSKNLTLKSRRKSLKKHIIGADEALNP